MKADLFPTDEGGTGWQNRPDREDKRAQHEALSDLLERRLSDLGTSNGSSARSRPQAAPDLMPDGYPASASVRPRSDALDKDDPELRAIPVVAVTAFFRDEGRRAYPRGRLQVLSKPISVGKFIENRAAFYRVGVGVSSMSAVSSSSMTSSDVKLLEAVCRPNISMC